MQVRKAEIWVQHYQLGSDDLQGVVCTSKQASFIGQWALKFSASRLPIKSMRTARIN